jgi:hypothetical protein
MKIFFTNDNCYLVKTGRRWNCGLSEHGAVALVFREIGNLIDAEQLVRSARRSTPQHRQLLGDVRAAFRQFARTEFSRREATND